MSTLTFLGNLKPDVVFAVPTPDGQMFWYKRGEQKRNADGTLDARMCAVHPLRFTENVREPGMAQTHRLEFGAVEQLPGDTGVIVSAPAR